MTRNALSNTLVALGCVTCAALAQAAPVASVTLNGGIEFLQTGTVLNSTGEGAAIVEVQYSFGAAAPGIATWDSNGGATLGGGTPSDFLSDPRWFQTLTWSGLSVPEGSSFIIDGLDIDLIETLTPLSVVTTIDDIGESLSNGTFTVRWSNGDAGMVELLTTGWSVTQTFRITGGTAIPLPGTLALAGLGLLAAAAGLRRCR